MKDQDEAGVNRVALKHIRHPKPGVREVATWFAQRAAFATDAAADAPQRYIAALRAETNNHVLHSMVYVLHDAVRKSEKAREAVIGLLDHSDPLIREEAVRLLAHRDVAKHVDGYYEKMLNVLENDTHDKTRSKACQGLALAEDQKAIAVFQEYFEATGVSDELVSGCFEGLVAAWTGLPYPKKPIQKGYELTIAILENPERTNRIEFVSNGISNLGHAKSSFESQDSAGKEWYETAKAFYDKKRLEKALQRVALDESARFGAREGALHVLKEVGAQRLLGTMVAPLKKGKNRELAKRLADQAERSAKTKL